MRIERFNSQHMDAAVQMVKARLWGQMQEAPSLDRGIINEDQIRGMLASCSSGVGVALLEADTLTGFMTGFLIEELLGPDKGILIPEWGHAIGAGQPASLYRQLYRHAGSEWVQQNVMTHVIVTLNCDEAVRDTLVWSGFGNVCVDAARPVTEIPAHVNPHVSISPLKEQDLEIWHQMVFEHYRHLLLAPIFKPDFDIPGMDELKAMLSEEGNHVWMAVVDGKPAGYMKIAPVEHGAAWIVNGNKKFAVNGAYVAPEYRGMGIAPMLLNAIMTWGKENGFIRCSVDFESTNPEACAFWLKYFQPVCRAMLRRIDSRAATRTL